MFSKKKKVDAKADPKGAPAAPAAENAAADPAPAPTETPPSSPAVQADDAAQEAPPSGGLLSSGLGSKGKTPSISASRLGGRPPSRPSAPAPAPAPAPPPAEPAPTFATPQQPTLPFGGGPVSGQKTSTATGQPNPLSGSASESELSKSGKMSTMAGLPQGGLDVQEAGADVAGKVKNPYKPNPLFDFILPISLAGILCGGFGWTIKWPKQKHDVYGFTEAEKQTQVRDPYLASPKLMDDIKKMDPVKLMDSGDIAGAMAAAKPLGSQALNLAVEKGMGVVQSGGAQAPSSKEDLAKEEQTVRDLLAAGMVLCKAGTKQEKDLGLTYMAKAEVIATYSKYVRLLYARELVRAHKDDEGIKEYEKITTLFLDPWSVPHKELGLLYMRANRGADAVQQLTELLKTDPSDPSIQRQLGLAMAQNGDQQAGFEEFRKGFTREQDVLSYPAAVKSLVDAHGGLVDATLQDVKKQAEKNPQDIKLQLDLARLDIATGKIKEARDLMETARKTQDTNPEVHEVMSEVMCRQSQAQSGYDEFRSAAQNLHLQQ